MKIFYLMSSVALMKTKVRNEMEMVLPVCVLHHLMKLNAFEL